MRDFVNQKAKLLQPSGIRKFFDIVRETEGAISLGVGEPDFVTPWKVRSAAITSLQRGYTQYGPTNPNPYANAGPTPQQNPEEPFEEFAEDKKTTGQDADDFFS